jgi:hypothetical protein
VARRKGKLGDRLHQYSIYGVRVTSDCPFDFPEVTDTEAPLADVEFVHAGEQSLKPSACDQDGPAPDAWFVYRPQPDGSTYLRCGRLYEFRVHADGTRVTCHPLEDGDPSVLQNFLFPQVLSFALVAQGFEQLHAAALNVEDAAIGFLGDCTFGKSTLAACFVQAGHQLITDDVLMIDGRSGRLLAIPGSGRIKLRSDSAGAFLSGPQRGSPLHPRSTKESFPLGDHQVQRTKLHLRQLYVLPPPAERDRIVDIEVQPLSPAATVQALLSNSFNVCVLDKRRLARQFAFATRVAEEIPGYAVRYPPGLHHLRAVRQAVTDHVRQTGS